MMKKIKPYILPYTVSIAIPLAMGILSAALTREDMKVYGDFTKPPLSPPGIVFPIVWSALYILMGISCALVYIHRRSSPSDARAGLCYYVASLLFNLGWSIIFFKLQAAFFALLWLLILFCLVLKYVIYYYKVNMLAAYLQIPYIIWICFAGYLNLGIWILN